jgi:hypothetical protein
LSITITVDEVASCVRDRNQLDAVDHEDAAAAFAAALDAKPRDPGRHLGAGLAAHLLEGLAVMFEADGAAWSQQQLANEPARLPFSRLAASFEKLSGADARLAYAQSAAVVRTLFDGGSPLAIGALLQDLARVEASN